MFCLPKTAWPPTWKTEEDDLNVASATFPTPASILGADGKSRSQTHLSVVGERRANGLTPPYTHAEYAQEIESR